MQELIVILLQKWKEHMNNRNVREKKKKVFYN